MGIGIGRAHTELGFSDPTKDVLVRKVLMGIKRTKGCGQRQVAPLLKEDLLRMLTRMEGLRGLRDRALLLIGFAAALRRSELAALDVEDVEHVDEGVLLNIRRSKTDQTALGRRVAIPYGTQDACPVRALFNWLVRANIKTGAVFRSIDRIDRIAGTRLSVQSIALIVKEHARQIGLDSACYSGHSLRAGLVTSAIQAGVGVHKIQQQTGHRSLAMVARYVRDNDLFRSNAAQVLF
jgi:integrase